MLAGVAIVSAMVGAFIAGLLFKLFLPSYLSEKGKNLATKEDIREITVKIESVKAALGSRQHIRQVRYEHEFNILSELSEKLVAVRDTAMALRPEIGYDDPDDPEMKNKRMDRFNAAARELYTFVETRQPFFPEDIYDMMKLFDQATWREFVQYKHQTPKDVVAYWDEAFKNGAEIGELASQALVRIRERVRRWEAFDPRP